MIGEMRTEALVKALGREGLTSETLIGLLVLALAADNVSIRTHEYAPIQSIASVIAEGGKFTSDTALIHTTAIKVLQTVLNCHLAYGVGGGLAARIAGDAIGADADLPHMGTEEFLSCLSRGALEAEASRHRVLSRGRVKDTRAALIEQVRETRLVLPAAQFALTEQESSDFANKGSHYAYDDEDEGDKTVDPSIIREDADLDNEDGDVDQVAARGRSRRSRRKGLRGGHLGPDRARLGPRGPQRRAARHASRRLAPLSDTICRGRRRRRRPPDRLASEGTAAACPTDTHARRLRRAPTRERSHETRRIRGQRRRHPHWRALPQGRAADRPSSPLLHRARRGFRGREACLRQRDVAVPGVPEAKTDDETRRRHFAKAVETRLEEHAS